MLLDAGCNPNVRNEDRLRSTSLHVATCQEHGKIVHLLLQAGADPLIEDSEGRTPCDFASASNGVWPLFAARGLTRTAKDVLVAKRVIHKVMPAFEDTVDEPSSGASTLAFYSRPGSAYVRSDASRGGGGGGGSSSSSSSSSSSGMSSRGSGIGSADGFGAFASTRRGGGGSTATDDGSSSSASSTATTTTLPRVPEGDGATVDPLGDGAPSGYPSETGDDSELGAGKLPTLSFWRDS